MDEPEEFEFELPGRDDDRPGLEELDDPDEVVAEEDDDPDEDDDYPEDATEEDVDLVIGLYREDGQPVAVALELDLANDLDALITQLGRLPGDAGAVGVVSIASELFVIVRVRGKRVQVFCSDVVAADDWPIARDAADYLEVDLPEADSDDSYPIGDSDILADAGLPDFELEAMAEDLEEDSATIVERIAAKLGFKAEFAKALAAFE